MSGQYGLEGWAFVNYVSLMLLYWIYDLLCGKDL